MTSPTGSLSERESAIQPSIQYGSSNEPKSADVEMHEFELNVAEEYMGTEADKRDMRMMGRAQVLRVGMTISGIEWRASRGTYS